MLSYHSACGLGAVFSTAIPDHFFNTDKLVEDTKTHLSKMPWKTYEYNSIIKQSYWEPVNIVGNGYTVGCVPPTTHTHNPWGNLTTSEKTLLASNKTYPLQTKFNVCILHEFVCVYVHVYSHLAFGKLNNIINIKYST